MATKYPLYLRVEVTRRIEPEDQPIAGNFELEDGSPDVEIEEWIRSELNRGNNAAWCGAIAECFIHLVDPMTNGVIWDWWAQDSIWAMSYESEEALWAQDPEQHDLAGNATRAALEKVLVDVHTTRKRNDRHYLSPMLRRTIARALRDWLAQNPNWAVWTDQWLERNA